MKKECLINLQDMLRIMILMYLLDMISFERSHGPPRLMLGETAGAIAKMKATDEIMDGIGDTFVTLIILSYQLGLEPTDCLQHAWNEIKFRKGRTENGVFIKEEN